MTLTNENINKIETLSIALITHFKDITILDDDGFPSTPNIFSFTLNKSINQIEITYDENLETNGYYSYSIHVDIPA